MDNQQDAAYWLALIRLPGVGPVRAAALLDRFQCPRNLFESDPKACSDLLDAAGIAYLRNPDWREIDHELTWLSLPGHSMITCHDPLYPPLLREIADPPTVLFVRGGVEYLSHLQLAIVGSRNPSPLGVHTATDFAQALTGAGLVVTSGLALGIDAASHRGAMIGGGRTIAVVGTGLDRVYPVRHQDLANDISHAGALVSEFPLGSQPRPDHFPRRNRIIAALSMGVLVVEANTKSGSLITARLAAEYGREVFAIPGSIHSPVSKGCHALIRQGAKLVETVQDVLEELAPLASFSRKSISPAPLDKVFQFDDQYATLLDIMRYEPCSVDNLVEHSGLTPEVVSSMLLTLELRGLVVSTPSGLFSRLPQPGILK